MQQHYFKEFGKEQFNKEANYQAILSKVKEEKKMKSVKLGKVAAVIVGIALLCIGSTQIYAGIKWNIEYKEYENRKVAYGSASVREAVEGGYNENIEMDYINQDGIGVKLDSLMITDDYFQMEINIKVPEEIEINTESLSYGFAVYDENNNIYGVTERLKGSKEYQNYCKKLYQELGVKIPEKGIYDIMLSQTLKTGVIEAQRGNIILKTTMNSRDGFPKSKKIYIRIFDIGYYMMEVDKEKHKIVATEDFPLSDAEWKMEVEVPEKFYEREELQLDLSEKINGVEIEKFEATDTNITLIAKVEGLMELIEAGKDMDSTEFGKKMNESIYITDEQGNIYLARDFGTAGGGRDRFGMYFEINKNNLDKKFFLNVTIKGEKYCSEIVTK